MALCLSGYIPRLDMINIDRLALELEPHPALAGCERTGIILTGVSM